MPMTVELLSKTGIGKIVNRVKANDEYSHQALRIVEGWRNIARKFAEKNNKLNNNFGPIFSKVFSIF